MRLIYSFIYFISIVFILLRLLWRSVKAPLYRKRVAERFALFKAPTRAIDLWVHAVSLGEVIAATPLIKAYQKQHKDHQIMITTMTPTGSDRAQKNFPENMFHVYLPYDLPFIVNRFLKKTKPRLLVIMETELWPNILYCTHKKNIPILLANARLSERSYKRYKIVKILTKKMVGQINIIASQTQIEKERFIKLGMPQDRIFVTGSIKFDILIAKDLEDKAAGLRRQLGESRPIWIAASTHEGEDEFILEAFQKVKKVINNALLVLVPRHPERFNKVAALAKRFQFEVVRRSEDKPCTQGTSVFLGDTMGELMLFYCACDVAFVGGSLVPVGGHNLLEPAALGKPSITGTHMHNFMQITKFLLDAKAIWQIQSIDELAPLIIKLLQNRQLRDRAGANAKAVVAQNRGALQKHLDLIDKVNYPI